MRVPQRRRAAGKTTRRPKTATSARVVVRTMAPNASQRRSGLGAGSLGRPFEGVTAYTVRDSDITGFTGVQMSFTHGLAYLRASDTSALRSSNYLAPPILPYASRTHRSQDTCVSS